MPKTPKIPPDDLNAFHEAMKGTKRHQHAKVSLKKAVTHKKPPSTSAKYVEFEFNEAEDLPHVGSEGVLSYKQPSLPDKILRKLRKGQYNVEAILDLHGSSVEKARTAIDSFLQECLQQEIRVALIIHGKGQHSQGPVLKNKLNHWLRQTPLVLAFCSAAPGHGSRGALYVLLKHLSEEIRF